MLEAVGRAQPELAAYRGFVRWNLTRFGVSTAELDDLTQEVWLVALSRSPTFADDRATKAWLVQVCRRVASSARRSRARAALLPETGEPEVSVAPEQFERVEREFDEQESLAALAKLSEAQLDVLALYGSGELSMREIAELVGEPEPTVYSRYRTAIDDVMRDLRRSATVGRRTSSMPAPRVPSTPPSVPPDREGAADVGELAVYRADRELAIGRLGNVVVANWRRRFYERSAADVGAAIKHTYERMQIPVVLINSGAPDLVLPNANERGTLRYYIQDTARQTVVAIDISDNLPVARLLATIVNGILLITRADRRFSFAMVPSVDSARTWAEPHARSLSGPLTWEEIARAIQRVRQLGLSQELRPSVPR